MFDLGVGGHGVSGDHPTALPQPIGDVELVVPVQAVLRLQAEGAQRQHWHGVARRDDLQGIGCLSFYFPPRCALKLDRQRYHENLKQVLQTQQAAKVRFSSSETAICPASRDTAATGLQITSSSAAELQSLKANSFRREGKAQEWGRMSAHRSSRSSQPPGRGTWQRCGSSA